MSKLPAAHQGDRISHNSHEIQDLLMLDMPWIYIQQSIYGPLVKVEKLKSKVGRDFFFLSLSSIRIAKEYLDQDFCQDGIE